MEVGAFQNVPGDHSDDRSAVLTILDNVLTVGGLARGKERAGQNPPQPGRDLKGAGGGMKNDTLADFADALRW
jgi:hypothetical protein